MRKFFKILIVFLAFSNVYSQQNNLNEILTLKKDRKTQKFAYFNSKNQKILGDYWNSETKIFKEYAIVYDPNPVLIDRNGHHIFNIFIFDNGADYPNGGLIRIIDNGKIGYIDSKTYKTVINPQFKCAYPFSNNKAKVSNICEILKEGEYETWESKNWFYIDKKGHKID